ncbi:hypothetical protein SAMN03159376_02059 [Pseudomonas sp. NFACC09-4]|uniref:hypothetical protein n=1 Tax=Pseudomonas sp. NFACC09-4 TaxID=1566237 RepID=UPI000908BDD3|nr:hypothetical protein [Pseudomonas sp. NFACC09-4]SFW53845.1 hypothetical protein SAMN03159376_02059 [Pseudomonas sp. NFACC09-4]
MKKIVGLLLLLAASSMSSAETKTVTVSDFQKGFIETVQNYSAQYEEAPNDLKKSTVARKRLEALAKLKGDPRKIVGWYGTIEKLGTNGDGDAFITIKLLVDNITFSTWNNSISDANSKTMIKNGTPLYDKISEMAEGNVVMFSGAIGKPKNLTERGKMTDPDFLFKFSDVEKVGDSRN